MAPFFSLNEKATVTSTTTAYSEDMLVALN